MAHYKKRGDNSWLLVLELGRDALGNRNRPTKTIRIEDPAILRAPKRLDEYLKTELTKFKMEIDLGANSQNARISFSQFTKEWLRKHVDAHLEEKTKENYRFHLTRRILPFFERFWLDDVTTRHLNDYLLHLRSPNASLRGKGPLKSASIVYNYRILQSIFRLAFEEKYIKENPMDDVKKPKEDDVKEMEVYDEGEIAKLFEVLDTEPAHIRLLVLLAVTTGMRRGEMAGLEWCHVDLDNGRISIKQTIPMTIDSRPVIKGTKNKNSVRIITLPAALVEELRLYKEDNQREWEGHEFVFSHFDGKALHPKRLTAWWTEFHRRHNLKPIRLHDLRHTSVSWMIYKKIHPEAIAKRVGHKNTKMLQIYGHIFKSVDQETASAFDEMVIKSRSNKDEVVPELSPDCPPNSPNDSNDHPTIH